MAASAVDVGDDDVFAQHRPVDQIVDAGAERLHPFEASAGAEHVVAQPRRKCQQYVGGRDIGPDLGMVIHKIDIKFWEFRLEAIAILGVEFRRQRQEDQKIGHAGRH